MDYYNIFTLDLLLQLYENVGVRYEINDGRIVDVQ